MSMTFYSEAALRAVKARKNVQRYTKMIEEQHLYSCVYVVNKYRTRVLKALFDLTWPTAYKNKQ